MQGRQGLQHCAKDRGIQEALGGVLLPEMQAKFSATLSQRLEMPCAVRQMQAESKGKMEHTNCAVDGVHLGSLGGEDDLRLVTLCHIDLGLASALTLQNLGTLPALCLCLHPDVSPW